jgi:hypothetical protein
VKKIMTKRNKILIVVILLLVAIQFIRPAKNNGIEVPTKNIKSVVDIPESTQQILINSCYDCHSNTTKEMWYMNIQPLGWWISHHIDEGKEELNFSEFSSYSVKKQAHKLEEIAEMINEDEMPLSSYTLMHANAKLSIQQREEIINWATEKHQQLKHAEVE